MDTEEIKGILDEKNLGERKEELTAYNPNMNESFCRIIEELINKSIEKQKDEEENEMSILQSFFGSISRIQCYYQQEKDRIDEQIKIASQTLSSQTVQANSMFSDVLPSMEYPFSNSISN